MVVAGGPAAGEGWRDGVRDDVAFNKCQACSKVRGNELGVCVCVCVSSATAWWCGCGMSRVWCSVGV